MDGSCGMASCRPKHVIEMLSQELDILVHGGRMIGS